VDGGGEVMENMRVPDDVRGGDEEEERAAVAAAALAAPAGAAAAAGGSAAAGAGAAAAAAAAAHEADEIHLGSSRDEVHAAVGLALFTPLFCSRNTFN
jgi:hypothetical protein